MIWPSLVMTAPNGPPQPFSTDSIASRAASSMNLRWPPFGAGLAWAGSAVIADVATTPAAATAEAALAKNERRPASGNEQQVQCVMERPSFLKSKAVPKYLFRVKKANAMPDSFQPVDLLLASRTSRGGGFVCLPALGRAFMMR